MNDKSKAPNFLGLIDENNHISLDDFKGNFLIIYFLKTIIKQFYLLAI